MGPRSGDGRRRTGVAAPAELVLVQRGRYVAPPNEPPIHRFRSYLSPAAIGLLAGWMLARLLSAHAGWVARRWARALGADVRQALEKTVAASAFAGVDRLDAARARLAAAVGGVIDDCARP